jgi:DNA-binding CsgD family transcriptional regulator
VEHDGERDLVGDLTPREREVLDLLRLGLSDAQIGQRLDISTATVSSHVSTILGKLGVRNRYEAAAWPEQPPWWAGALAPLAFLWRRAGSAAALVSGVVLVALLAGAALLAFLLLRGDDGQAGVEEGVLRVPYNAIEGLTNYAFTSRLDVASAEGDLSIDFDGVFQAPDRIQGSFALSGEPYEQLFADVLDQPAASEVIVVGEYAWWREDGGDWQRARDISSEGQNPLIAFRQYATPEFYLEALQWDALEMSVAGQERINGIDTVAVRLDKAATVALLSQGTAIKTYPDNHTPGPVYPGIIENAQQVLPESFSVDVWFAEGGLYPARIVFEYDVTENDSSGLAFGFGTGSHIRLQLDITEPDAGVEVEPGEPIATTTPSPTTPPGDLTGDQKAQIAELVGTDPRVREIAGNGGFGVSADVVAWATSDREVLGGYTYVSIDPRTPRTYEGAWPRMLYDQSEVSDPPFEVVEEHYRAEGFTRLRVLVYLPEGRVVGISPEDGTISNRTPEP